MNFAWARAAGAACAGLLLLSACGNGGGDASADSAARARAAEYFLTANARAEGVRTTESGLQYKVVNSGPADGIQPDSNDLVRVEYEGSLTNGTVFDSSYQRGAPAVMSPQGLVPGWTEALQMMRPGDEWMLYVPPALGYGEEGRPPAIPGNSVLVFRVKLLAVAPAPGGHRGVGEASG
ncbi:FKBP-type peptidyl-prolyl cis-trans isomerase [Brevundimonas sp.]|uniref:FKBP-type peptidyl-prolyl cis-trans isomerase n=1 Tax=Brevundimonas sp. TaxID=1871086 RepID=UPI001E0A08F8|nr:FKBP-type peptidyl-prolyl cis-trans isomerase [Brevundimonas sp.]MBL0946644.1 FKBP-type peptidyl-prolyl cis-trans isomerase [Brevundimonas sp.]